MFSRLGPLMPVTFGKLAYEMWFTAPRFKIPSREKDSLATASQQVIDLHGLPMTTYSWGEGPSILFIHGWSGRGTQACSYAAPLTQAGYKTVSFDGPAHGNTPGKQSSVLQFADAVLAMQAHYGPFAGVITHSFGGMILTFASQFGFQVQRAACLCPPENFDIVIDNFAKTLALPDSVRQVMLKKFQATHGDLLRDMVSTVHQAKHIDYPLLLVHDKDDPEIPWQSSQDIANAVANSQLVLTQGLKHRRIVRDEKVVDAIVRFITEA